VRRRTVTKPSAATDAHILRLHSAMADKVLANPALLAHISQTLEQRYQAGLLRHSGYIHWYSILDCFNTPELFKAALLDNSEQMRKYRRRTIFTGILTEEERQAVLMETAE
jgi:hypothetical protein